ncbi:MAG: DUF4124 domain-containing protein [Proteobacteria bacterium]|nr:DUF4124 domain-containing protein [Pseudomonadota bacterium]
MKPHLLGLWLLAASAQAGTVYRCGTNYQDTPCPASQPGQVIEADDSRSAADRKAAEVAARAEARRAEALRTERHAREREAAKVVRAQAKAAKPVALAASRPAPAEKPVLYRPLPASGPRP